MAHEAPSPTRSAPQVDIIQARAEGEIASVGEATVTPRFPQGLSVAEVSGQWRGADGTIVREAGHVLQLVHADDLRAEKSVAEIVAACKTQFQQEAVLRVRSPVCMSF